MKEKQTLVRLDGIKFEYPDSEGTFQINIDSIDILSGEICYLFGPSGCGKTTILNLIAGIIKPTGGTRKVFLEIENRRLLCYVMQRSTMLPWLTIHKNIMQESRFRGIKLDKSKVASVANNADLTLEDMRKRPSQLSGGMMGRAEIIRALLMKPRLLLMDEAFGSVDSERRYVLSQEIAKRVEHEGMAVVACSHQPMEVMLLADKVIFFEEAMGGKIPKTFLNTPRKERDENWFSGPEASGLREAMGWRFKPVH